MTEKRDRAGLSTGTNRGTETGAIVAGLHNTRTITAATLNRPPSDEELRALTVVFAQLRADVANEAEPQVKDQALERVEELEEAADPTAPDVTVMAATRNWFVKYAPQLAAAVTGVIVHPTIGRIIHASGDALVRDYLEKFPGA